MILAIHDRLIAEFGGEPGVRDLALLESALASPRNRFAYGERDVFVLAEAYASALSRDHSFVDGNKRIALTAAAVFLELNGKRFAGTQEEAVHFTMALASRSLAESEFADWLRRSAGRGDDASHGKRKAARKSRSKKRES
jgi:death-on-curing protein